MDGVRNMHEFRQQAISKRSILEAVYTATRFWQLPGRSSLISDTTDECSRSDSRTVLPSSLPTVRNKRCKAGARKIRGSVVVSTDNTI